MSAGLMAMFVAGTALSASEPVSTLQIPDRAPLSYVADELCGTPDLPHIDKACLETVASTEQRSRQCASIVARSEATTPRCYIAFP
ncbi:MAG: hypothetical protein R3D02_11860 [Hyphomicrobiales bacterium]